MVCNHGPGSWVAVGVEVIVGVLVMVGVLVIDQVTNVVVEGRCPYDPDPESITV